MKIIIDRKSQHYDDTPPVKGAFESGTKGDYNWYVEVKTAEDILQYLSEPGVQLVVSKVDKQIKLRIDDTKTSPKKSG